MAFLQPTDRPRLNEPIGFLLLIVAVVIALSLISHHPFDRSWSVAGGSAEYRNLIGEPGAYGSDLALQWLGLTAFLLPVFLVGLAWCWVRSAAVKAPWARLCGGALFIFVCCAAMELYSVGGLWQGAVLPGGAVGAVLIDLLVGFLNRRSSHDTRVSRIMRRNVGLRRSRRILVMGNVIADSSLNIWTNSIFCKTTDYGRNQPLNVVPIGLGTDG